MPIPLKKYGASVDLLAAPFAFLFFTGLYLFVLPSANKWRATHRRNGRLTSCAFGDYQRDVVGLFMRVEFSSLI